MQCMATLRKDGDCSLDDEMKSSGWDQGSRWGIAAAWRASLHEPQQDKPGPGFWWVAGHLKPGTFSKRPVQNPRALA